VLEDEYIELYNPTNAPINIGGYKLMYRTASTNSTTTNYTLIATVPANTMIAARGYYLIAHSKYSGTGAAAADQAYASTFASHVSASSGNFRLGTSASSTDLSVTTGIVDVLGFGTGRVVFEGTAAATSHPANGSMERKATADSTSATMADPAADGLKGNGHDSDDNKADFVNRTTRDPQSAKSPAEPL
jgi:hypothetical protein